ncbi:cyclase [Sulfurifustis variabilis]|uniref:Cyclase n=1 Tax=Sulfurifustis variabilis TaxID=1675686 RepID=A0A1B4VEC7_9GAMM|nr:type II toxin-antitoxin system RatA family toxin [Sulfurifustis variabilis]BAU48997.1 cyclase [Sulfurifustis variabilis]
MSSIRRSALVPYSDAEMYALVADIPAYPRFLPWCGDARVLSRTEDEVLAAITIAYGGIHKTFTTRNLLQKNKMMEIRLVEGPFRYLHGYWRFQPLDERSSKISVDLEFEVENRLLAVALTPVFTTIATQLVDAFHKRAIELHGRR